MRNKFISALLTGCLVVGCIGPVSALTITNTRPVTNGSATTPVKLTTEALTFSVTVPTSLPVNVDKNGVVTVAGGENGQKIINNGAGPVKVEGVKVEAVAPWELVGDFVDLHNEKVGSDKFSFSVQDANVAADGTCTAKFDVAPANGAINFKYNAKVAPQNEAIINEQMAKVVFTVGWDNAPVVVVGEWDVSEAEDTSVMAILTSNGVITIRGNGEMAATGCRKYIKERKNIKTAVIENGITSIPSSAFLSCPELTTITIPASLQSVGDKPFSNCPALEIITIDENNVNFSLMDGILFNKDKTQIIRYPESRTNTSYVIPDNVTRIGNGAFYNCKSLVSVTIPDGVITIGEWAFKGCSSLTSVNIPNSVTDIEQYAFSGCAFETIKIPDSVTNIETRAFESTALKSITIPRSITSIEGAVFNGCKSLALVNIPDSVTSIGGGAFIYTALTSITIPNSVTDIGEYAFAYSPLTSVTIPEGVVGVGDWAFSNCDSLVSVDIPESLTSIGNGVFRDCSSLSSITYKGSEYKTVYSFKTAFNAIEGNSMGGL